ncbi:leucine-rich repeat-containing protein 59-like isoform X1 [Bolinopsis microptera]|uniref:leucine-rich repeat-containing protein 59-like isoform X1 n=1 Tax=Bolinopsis microptera TaxID=2820187 RepID=UPI0030793F49
MSKGSKIVVKDYLDRDEFDLSLQSLTNSTLPVKDLAANKKGKKLDLSKNQITVLPDNFVFSMGHLVKLDLSANGLRVLPDNFGNLALLQHLDLFNNKLTVLPVGFYKLKLLKWLDVKENPLEYPVQEVVGLCRNDTECKTCALQVSDFMKKENAEQEKKKQKELELKRAKKEALKRELERLEELENEEKKRIRQEGKAKEKAKRRAEFEKKQSQEQIKEESQKCTPPTIAVKHSSRSLPDLNRICLMSALVLFVVAVTLALLVKPDFGDQYVGLTTVTADVLKSVGDAFSPVATTLNTHLLTHAPNIQKSIVSTGELLREMLEICGDTVKLGYELAIQELSQFSTYIQKTSS